MQTHEGQEYLTPQEAADLVRCSRQTIYGMIRRGELEAVRFGRRLLVPRRALEKYLRRAEKHGCDNSH